VNIPAEPASRGTASGNYCIKPDYRPNGAVVTQDSVSGEFYWNSTRLRRSLSYQFAVYEFAGKLIERGGIHRVVDVGCGVATKLERLHHAHPGVEVVGIDQPATIEFCRNRYRFGTWVADDLGNPSGSNAGIAGDLVICSDVIEHVEDPDVLLVYLKRRTSPGGRILLSTPERDLLRGPSCSHSPNRYHVREWNRSELQAYLRASGFVILEHVLQLPVRLEASKLFYSHVVKRALAGRPVRWNQACLLGIG
jgi:SAM-dependent methyltransferase